MQEDHHCWAKFYWGNQWIMCYPIFKGQLGYTSSLNSHGGHTITLSISGSSIVYYTKCIMVVEKRLQNVI